MNKHKLAQRLVMGMLGGVAKYGAQQTLTLQPAAVAGKDTQIKSQVPTVNYGVSDNTLIGERSDDLNAVFRFLIQFDISSIPVGSIIDSAVMSLYCTTDKSANTRIFRIFRVKRAWTEGTGNGSATNDGATWNTYDGVNAWQTAGGFGANDCEQTDIGNREFTDAETINQFKDFVLNNAAIEEMLTGGTWVNNGFLLKADTELDDAYLFLTSDNTTVSNRPKLVIKYRSPL